MAIESKLTQTNSVPTGPARLSEATVRELIEESLGSGNLTVAEDSLAAEYTGLVDGMPDHPPGPAGFKRFVTRLRRTLFRLEVSVDEVVDRNADVVAHWTASGRQERPFLGMEPMCVVDNAGQEPEGDK